VGLSELEGDLAETGGKSVCNALFAPSCDRLPHRPFQHSTNYCAAASLRQSLLIAGTKVMGLMILKMGEM
jgi:hypothetical protein